MNEPVLVVLAAGMGSRFGGLKQITPVDAQGHKLMDFSLYDARQAGFQKVVFIIKEAIAQEFRESTGAKLEPFFELRYAYQELDCLPAGYSVPEGRVKPWGTAHAIACAADVIDGPFAVVNADDFYGRSAFARIYRFLKEQVSPAEHAMVGYRLKNTVTKNGHVARGVCEMQDGYLTRVVERTHIEVRPEGIAYTEDGNSFHVLPEDALVSMNLWGFHEAILQDFTARFPAFLDQMLPVDPLKCEYFLPSIANAQLAENRGRIRVLQTEDAWHGVTYREDLGAVQAAIQEMKQAGQYPQLLWASC